MTRWLTEINDLQKCAHQQHPQVGRNPGREAGCSIEDGGGAPKRCTVYGAEPRNEPGAVPYDATRTSRPIGSAIQQRVQVVFDCNPTPMWVFDLDTHRFLAVNAAAVAEYGYPPEKFLTLTIRDIYEEADRARFDDALAGDAQDLYLGLWLHRRQNGTSLHVEIRSNDLRSKTAAHA